MGAHRGDKGGGLFGGLRVKKDIKASGDLTAGGDVTITGDVTATNYLVGNINQGKTVEVAFAGETGNGGAFAWEVPVDCLVTNLTVAVVEAPSTTRSIDAGGPVDNATTSSDTLIDGGRTGTTDGTAFSSESNAGSNGEHVLFAEAGKFITGTLNGALAGDPVIRVFVTYMPLG